MSESLNIFGVQFLVSRNPRAWGNLVILGVIWKKPKQNNKKKSNERDISSPM